MIHHKVGKLNKGADALLSRYVLLSALESKVLRFEQIKGLYGNNEDFTEILEKCSKHAHGLFDMENGSLFKGTQLCMPKN